MSQSSKIKLAEGLESLLQTTDLSRVTIADIVSASGVSRQTFYNNFTDIYDLVFWAHEYRTREAIETFWVEEDFRQAFCTALSIIRDHRLFYQKIIRKSGLHSFQNSFGSANHTLSLICIKSVSGTEADPDTKFLLTLYWTGAARMLVDWISTGMRETPEAMAELFYQALPQPLRKYWSK